MDYFPHDTDAVNDEKIEILRMLYGNDGYAFYFITLERIYKSPKFEMNISDTENKIIHAKRIGISIELFEQILETSIKYGCFDKEIYQKKGLLTSNGIKKRADVVVSKREYMRGLKNQTKTEFSASETPPETTPEMPQSKVKESKSKSKVLNTRYSENDDLHNAICGFVEFRSKVKKPLTDKAVELLIMDLKKLTDKTDEQIQILNRSIMQGWTGVYPLKSNGQLNGQQKKNGFHNLPERDLEPNLDDLLRQKGRGK